MRVTNYIQLQNSISDVLTSEGRLQKAQDQVSTGLKVQKPSDAPDRIAALLQTNAQIGDIQQRQTATNVYLPLMQASDSALGDVTNLLRNVNSLVLQARDATTSSDQRQILAGQVEQLASQLRDSVNTQVGGKYLFSGTADGAPAFAAGPPVTYTGSKNPLQISPQPGDTFDVSVTGDKLLNARAGADGQSTDLFANLTSLAQAIRSGDQTGMSNGLTNLNDDLNNVITLRSDLGAREQYVQLVQNRLSQQLNLAQGAQSDIQNADISQAVIDEQSAQNAQQAALLIASKTNQPSLLDYLR